MKLWDSCQLWSSYRIFYQVNTRFLGFTQMVPTGNGNIMKTFSRKLFLWNGVEQQQQQQRQQQQQQQKAI